MSLATEPSFLINFEPILTNADPTADGRNLRLLSNSGPTLVDSIQLQVSDTENTMVISYKNQPIINLGNIYLMGFNINNYVIGAGAGGEIELTAVNSGNTQYDINSPLCDLFREGDIVRMTMGTSIGIGLTDSVVSNNVDLFVGSINNVRIIYTKDGLTIALRIEGLLSILDRSATVQTANDQSLIAPSNPQDQQFLSPITVTDLNFSEFLHTLLSETIISETVGTTKYFAGVTNNQQEALAIGEGSGSAICPSSKIFIFTPPTASKLNVIMQTLFAYQRVFYVDNSGNFIITPLQTFYNITNSWQLDINGSSSISATASNGSAVTSSPIALTAIEIEKNTSNIQNRVFLSLISILTQFILPNVNGDDNTTGAYAIATIDSAEGQALFPRVYDFTQSEKYLQTLFSLQELNESIIQNSGLLNLAQNFKTVQGLKSVVTVNGNADTIVSNSSDTEQLKYFLGLYASKNLAEQLFNDMHITATMSTNLTYNSVTDAFRPLPLNEMVKLPSVNNNVFDGQQQAWCYGYSMIYTRGSGAMTTLHLAKPMTWTALWSDSIVEVT